MIFRVRTGRFILRSRDPSNGEHNINYAAVYFGVDSGYEMAQKVQTETGILTNVLIDGVTDSLTEGRFVCDTTRQR